jgi:hypothetical protein
VDAYVYFKETNFPPFEVWRIGKEFVHMLDICVDHPERTSEEPRLVYSKVNGAKWEMILTNVLGKGIALCEKLAVG